MCIWCYPISGTKIRETESKLFDNLFKDMINNFSFSEFDLITTPFFLVAGTA